MRNLADYRDAARAIYAGDNEIVINPGEDVIESKIVPGCWVPAWVFVADEEVED